jgi:hypothetical protein
MNVATILRVSISVLAVAVAGFVDSWFIGATHFERIGATVNLLIVIWAVFMVAALARTGVLEELRETLRWAIGRRPISILATSLCVLAALIANAQLILGGYRSSGHLLQAYREQAISSRPEPGCVIIRSQPTSTQVVDDSAVCDAAVRRTSQRHYSIALLFAAITHLSLLVCAGSGRRPNANRN